MQLIITNTDGTEALRMEIGEVDPKRATVAVIQAIDSMPKPRKPRSDAGKSRTRATV